MKQSRNGDFFAPSSFIVFKYSSSFRKVALFAKSYLKILLSFCFTTKKCVYHHKTERLNLKQFTTCSSIVFFLCVKIHSKKKGKSTIVVVTNFMDKLQNYFKYHVYTQYTKRKESIYRAYLIE